VRSSPLLIDQDHIRQWRAYFSELLRDQLPQNIPLRLRFRYAMDEVRPKKENPVHLEINPEQKHSESEYSLFQKFDEYVDLLAAYFYKLAHILACETPGALMFKSRKYPNGVCATEYPAFKSLFSASLNNSFVNSGEAFDSDKCAKE